MGRHDLFESGDRVTLRSGEDARAVYVVVRGPFLAFLRPGGPFAAYLVQRLDASAPPVEVRASDLVRVTA